MRECIWCTIVRWSLTFGASVFVGPVTFEIVLGQWLQKLIVRPSIANVMEQA